MILIILYRHVVVDNSTKRRAWRQSLTPCVEDTSELNSAGANLGIRFFELEVYEHLDRNQAFSSELSIREVPLR